MKRLSRRAFLAASAALTAAPAFGAPASRKAPPRQPEQPTTGGLDVIIVGAGAAGIAAARRLTAAGRRCTLIEAAAQVGGRCITDTTTFGVPYDRGAHFIRTPEYNPVAKLAIQTGLDIYPSPPGQRMRVGLRYAREGEMEDYLAALVRTTGAITMAASGRADMSCAQALPKDLGAWRPAIEFFLGPYSCGKELSEVSAVDLARLSEHDTDALCRQGHGALLTKLAAGLPVQLSTPVTRIDSAGRAGVAVETARGRLEARAVIVTASTNVLTSGQIKFTPDLPKRQLDAAAKLKLGSYDRVALELSGNPLGLRADERVFEKADNTRTAFVLANVAGSALCFVDVGGKFGRELAAQGEAAMTAFATDWLAGLYGADIKKAVKRTHATRWNEAPFALGAISAAAPGGQPSRRVLMEPVGNRIWFAGEAAHETLWGTVGGAWESGERAADAIVNALGVPARRS